MDRMVRTQLYLPSDLHEALRRRSRATGLSLAEQVRIAVRDYLANAGDSDNVLREDDGIYTLVGAGEGPADGASEHDKYLYGSPSGGKPEDGE